MLISIVVPCYNSEHTIEELVTMTLKELEKSPEYQAEFVLVNDCSKDNTMAAIRRLCEKYPFVKGINLSKISASTMPSWQLSIIPKGN